AWRESARTSRRNHRPWLIAAGIAAAAVLAGGTLWQSARPGSPVVHNATPSLDPVLPTNPLSQGEYRTASTRLGERQLLVLEDGTQVTLNTSSRVEVDYRGPLRRVNLLTGEALFRVAKNPNRAFVVTAGNRE